MKLPTISIVTLSYNQAKFLPRCLSSVHGQLAPGDEHFCVDPGSTDGSRELLGQSGVNGVKLLLEPDEGPGDGLNKGLGQARGEVFGFLNADDELAPGALTFVREFFAANPSVDIVLGAIRVIDEHSRASWRKRISTTRDSVDVAVGAGRFYQQGFFFRRQLWEKGVRFNVANRTCWDWEFFADACLAGAKVCSESRVLGCFRLHGDSITGRGQNSAAYEADRVRIMTKARKRMGCSSMGAMKRRVSRKIDLRVRLQEFLP